MSALPAEVVLNVPTNGSPLIKFQFESLEIDSSHCKTALIVGALQ